MFYPNKMNYIIYFDKANIERFYPTDLLSHILYYRNFFLI